MVDKKGILDILEKEGRKISENLPSFSKQKELDTQNASITEIPHKYRQKKKDFFTNFFLVFIFSFLITYVFHPYILLAYYFVFSPPTVHTETIEGYSLSDDTKNLQNVITLEKGEIRKEDYEMIRRFYKKTKEASKNLAWLDKKEEKQEESVKPNLTQKKEVKLQLPFNIFVANANKIVLWGNKTSNLLYRDLKHNIQKELAENSVVSFYNTTPIIFSHSSGWTYNFWVHFLWFKKWDKVIIEWENNGKKYKIPVRIEKIIRDIPWSTLNEHLSKIKYNDNHIILDTCELDWTKRRILIATMEDIIF